MNDFQAQQRACTQQWTALDEQARQAIEWIEAVRPTAPRLDSEADDLILALRRARNTAAGMAQASRTPLTVGFFGLSQAGKSYLISALAANAGGKLMTRYGHEDVDFLEHVNPPGTGKEATGLVTRFSRQHDPAPEGYPVELRLFSEIELAKVLANTWFNDFDHESAEVEYELSDEIILATVAAAGARKGPAEAGVNPEDVVSLWDYLKTSFEKSVRKLEHVYWPAAVALAPQLSIAQRARLFAPLWGEQPKLTDTYVLLANTLRSVGGARTVYAQLDALIQRGAAGLSQRDSIMNVDMLNRLGQSSDVRLQVMPENHGAPGQALDVSAAQLAALTAELRFPLIEQPRHAFVNDVDILDFPGYRGRLQVRSLTDDGSGPSIGQLLLRGKVAYLFERYTDTHALDSLVMCTRSEMQSEVTSVSPIVTRWVESVQGATPEARQQQPSGLVWAMTMLDRRLIDMLSMAQSQHDDGWNKMIDLTLTERFGECEWMKAWAPGKRFNTAFLVRKPGLLSGFIETSGGQELGLMAGKEEALMALRQSFVDNQKVREHIAAPVEAWEAVLSLGDGGMSRLGSYLAQILRPQAKLNRLRQHWEGLIDRLVQKRLSRLYQAESQDGEVDAKRAIALQIRSALVKVSTPGDLLLAMELPDDAVRELYLDDHDDIAIVDEQEASTAAVALEQDPFADLDPFSDGLPSMTDPIDLSRSPAITAHQSGEQRFARRVFNAWVTHMRGLGARTELVRRLGLNREAVDVLVDEMIAGADRLALPTRLAEEAGRRIQSGARRESTAARQVLAAQTVLRNFITWFHHLETPPTQRPRSLANNKGPLFTSPCVLEDGLPALPPAPASLAQWFHMDWISAVLYLTRDNAGYTAGREISAEHNAQLGKILSGFTLGEIQHAR